MAREPIEVIKQQLGNLLAEIAVLTSKLETAQEEIEELKKSNVREPDKKPVTEG